MRSDVVSSIRDLSLQSRATGAGTAPTNVLSFYVQASSLIPSWWSEQRDLALSRFWKTGDQISGALYSMQAKMVTIPFHIEPLDMSLKSHILQAEKFTRLLYEGSEYGEGWSAFFTPSLESLLTQDNGRFMEIIGKGNKLGPIEGTPLTVAHLDPSQCQRTGDPEYPVLFTDTNGKRHRLHYTRVMFDAQMPSSRVDMFGVGFCAISRAIHNAQHLVDIATYEEEKLGSRPFKGIMLAGGGLDPEAVGNALIAAQSRLDAQGFTRFARMPIVGSPEIENPTLQIASMTEAPEYFNKDQSVSLSMAAIALAFGVDARELWPSQTSGATRADAMLSHIKMQGKGPGHILETTERLFNHKFLPAHLRIVFDYQDDTQDRQRAEIRQVRSRARDRDIQNKITTERIERQKMLEGGEIDTAQFTELELSDGRLEDGKSVLTLFVSEQPEMIEMLGGISNPLSISSNDAETMLKSIEEQRIVVYEIVADVDVGNIETNARQAIAALDELQRLYEEKFDKDEAKRMQEEAEARKRERDQFGDNDPKGTQGDLKPSTSETKLSEHDTSMDTDDKKKGFLNRVKSFFIREEDTTKEKDVGEEVSGRKSVLVEMIYEKDSSSQILREAIADAVGKRKVVSNVQRTIPAPSEESEVTVIEPSVVVKGDEYVEVIDVERNEYGEISKLTRRKVRG